MDGSIIVSWDVLKNDSRFVIPEEVVVLLNQLLNLYKFKGL